MTTRRRDKRKNPWLLLLLTAALLLALAVILNETLFRIGNVEVEGLRTADRTALLEDCGLEKGISYFAVREDDIREGVRKNRYLIYQGMEKFFPNRLVIRVQEREICASITVQEKVYLMDETAFVLERAENTWEAAGRLKVSGFSVREARVGQAVSYTNALQLSAYSAVTKELIEQDALGEFTEMNLADPSDIYLTSASGFLVSLGGPEEIRAKLLTARGVLEYMRIYDMKKGTLDATVPGYATYMPDSD